MWPSRAPVVVSELFVDSTVGSAGNSVVKTPSSSEGGMAWTSGQGTTAPHATGCGQKLKKNKQLHRDTSPSSVFWLIVHPLVCFNWYDSQAAKMLRSCHCFQKMTLGWDFSLSQIYEKPRIWLFPLFPPFLVPVRLSVFTATVMMRLLIFKATRVEKGLWEARAI